MRKNVWIWNHYATNMFFDQAGRHYWFAENLIKEGYKPTIFSYDVIITFIKFKKCLAYYKVKKNYSSTASSPEPQHMSQVQ